MLHATTYLQQQHQVKSKKKHFIKHQIYTRERHLKKKHNKNNKGKNVQVFYIFF